MNDLVEERKRITSYIMSMIGLLCLLGSLFVGIYEYILETHSLHMSAIVKSIDLNSSSLLVQYVVNNVEYENTIAIPMNKNYAVHDEVMVKVDIDNPKKIVKTHFMLILGIFGGGLLISIFSASKSRKYLQSIKNIKKLKTTGIFIQASIAEIIINNKGKKYKGEYPYKLRCKYFNPIDNQIYVFDSMDTYTNLNEIISKYNSLFVIVYIDKENTTNYYVDLESLIPHVNIIDPIAFMNGDYNKDKQEESVGTENGEKDGDKEIK